MERQGTQCPSTSSSRMKCQYMATRAVSTTAAWLALGQWHYTRTSDTSLMNTGYDIKTKANCTESLTL
jgi:hypothetical protein